MKSHEGYGGSTGWLDHFPRLQKLLAAALSIVFALTNASKRANRPLVAPKADSDLTLSKIVDDGRNDI